MKKRKELDVCPIKKKKKVCCCQKSDQHAIEQPNSLITPYFAWTENVVRLHREEFLEGIPLCLSAAGVLHMEGQFPSQLLDTYGGISGGEVRRRLWHAAIFAYKSASIHFKAQTVITQTQTHF